MGFLCPAPAAPPAPDYAGAAVAQGASNKETAIQQGYLNNPNVRGPLGGQTVTFDSTTNQPTITQNLTPQAQQTLEAQQRVQGALSNLGEKGIGNAQKTFATEFQPNLPGIQTNVGPTDVQKGLDLSNVAQMPVNAGSTGQEAIMSRLAPQLERQQKSTAQNLANQGLVPGGEAYTNAMRDQSNAQNDLLTQAALQGIGLDTAANQQGFNQALSTQSATNSANAQDLNQRLAAAQFGNTAQGQSLAQQLQLRNQPLNEITGLMSGSQLQMPQFQGYTPTNITPAPIFAGAQAAGANALQNYGLQNASSNANMGALGSLGGAFAGSNAGSAMLAGLFSALG